VLSKNLEIEIEITGTTHDGSGVGRYEDMVIFTPGCTLGDRIKVRIVAIKKSYAFGKLLKIIRPSLQRIKVDCPVFSKCGGCVFRHISYEGELRIKEQRVKDTIAKLAHIVIEPEPIVGSPQITGYRNKAQYPVGIIGGELLIGFFAGHSHRIIESSGCPLQPPIFEAVLKAFRKWIEVAHVTVYDEFEGKGLLRHIFIRQAEATGELMACAVINGGSLPSCELLINLLQYAAPQITSIVFNINRENTNVIMGDKTVTLWGKECITDILGGVKFEISPLSFYQVNSLQAEQLYAAAADFAKLTGDELLLDLYCGAGTIGLFMASRVKKVIGVEVVPQAVEDARHNAEINGISNAEFICADAEQTAEKLLAQGLCPDVVVVDPPRKGLTVGTINAIVQMSPKRVIYVSCDPATLARDIAIFIERGYVCKRVKPFDMFPRTAHVECIVQIQLVEKGKIQKN